MKRLLNDDTFRRKANMPDPLNNFEEATMKEGWHLDKKVPLSIILAIVAQTAVLFMWGARLDERSSIKFLDHERRLTHLEDISDKSVSTSLDICQRIARIEERSEMTLAVVQEMRDSLRDSDGRKQ